MKIRYQMRGLGIGIVVTALLMGVALDDGVPLSDAEIKILAAQLGMVESDSLKLTDVQQSSTSHTVQPTVNPTEVPTTVPTAETTSAPVAETTIEPTVDPTEAPTEAPTGTPEVAVICSIVVKSGYNSYTVSKQLAEVGLVEDASEYDSYLCKNGYAGRIQVGTFEIPMGSSPEEIAKIITKTR